MRVLVVEDSPADARLVRELLREAPRGPFEPAVAGRLDEALARAARERFDAALLDLTLPDARGLDTLDRFLGAAAVPVVVLTGLADEQAPEEALRRGAQDFVPKAELEERRGAEARLRHTVRALRTLAACSRVPQDVSDEQELAAAYCRIAVEEGGYRMAWVGAKEEDEARTLRPVAAAGEHGGYLDSIRVSWAEDALGRGPAGQAVRTGRPSVVRHMETDPAFAPWRRLARAHGFRSSAALPLRWDEEVVGMMGVYSEEADAFDDEEVALLQRVAQSLSKDWGALRVAGTLAETEERLRQAEKLAAVGQLAGGVAHDFNNLLQIILGQSDLLLTSDRMSAEDRERLHDVLAAADRAAALTRQLLAFSRRQVLEPRVLDINPLVRGAVKMLDRLLGEQVRIEVRLEPEPWKVLVDPSQIDQVLLNLAVNARDAMPGGGTLTLETANVELDETYSEAHRGLVPSGPYLMLAVSDTGQGMDAETRRRIFEPFFTTKGVGEGTGLGLATVYGTVKQSGGYIWVYSEPGTGTTFKIYLPRVEGRAEVEAAAPAEPPAPASGTVLLVEDEPRVRATVKEDLIRTGYQVLEAEGPGEALLVAEAYGSRLDLLLTDVVMPRMNGSELARGVRELVPAIQVLFMTGYTENAVVHHGVLDSGVPLLHKPFTREALARAVAQVLRGR
ncbi:MAG: hypothetical protein Kow0092_36400 [Deferrisomatales bacterium]